MNAFHQDKSLLDSAMLVTDHVSAHSRFSIVGHSRSLFTALMSSKAGDTYFVYGAQINQEWHNTVRLKPAELLLRCWDLASRTYLKQGTAKSSASWGRYLSATCRHRACDTVLEWPLPLRLLRSVRNIGLLQHLKDRIMGRTVRTCGRHWALRQRSRPDL